MNIMKQIVQIIAYCFFLIGVAYGQPVNSKTIYGKIVDIDQIAIPDATIKEPIKNNSVKSDINGEFSIAIESQSERLIINHLGYNDNEISISDSLKTYIVILERSSELLEEVQINTGYQNISKERITGSFESVGNERLNRIVSADILSRLEGQSSVYFDNRFGNRSISVRGRSTIFGNADPLIVIDNFPYEGDINNINPNDIEKIDILKDAAAASIWGVRAANGVLVITTKKGAFNRKPTFEVNANVSVGAKPDLYYKKTMTTSDFINTEIFLYENGFYNSSINNTRRPIVSPVIELLENQRQGFISSGILNQTIDEMRRMDVREDLGKYLYRNAIKRQYAINYRGGTTAYSYYVSGGIDRNDDYLVGNDLNRLTLKSEHIFKPISNITIQGSISYTHNQKDQNSTINSIMPTGKELYPYASLKDSEGNVLPIVKDYRMGFIDTVGGGELLDWQYRPLQELEIADNRNKLDDIRMNLGVQYKINDHVGFDVIYQYGQQNQKTANHYSLETYMARNQINLYTQNENKILKYKVPMGGILDLTDATLTAHSARGQINYNDVWDNIHELTFMAGAEIRQTNSMFNNGRTYGYDHSILTFGNVNYEDHLPTYDNLRGSLAIPNPASFSDNLLRFTSVYGNGAYTYKNKFTFSLSARKDASNLFGVNANQKGVPLWSAGLAWQLNKEDFYRWDLVPSIKLKASYGYSGNLDNSLSALTTVRYLTNAFYTGLNYATVSNPGNPELRWEKSGIANVGIEFSTKENILSGSIEYYRKTGKDLIGDSPVDPTTGVMSPMGTFTYRGNVANMQGTGLDIILRSRNTNGKIRWETDWLFNVAKNKVTKYYLEGLTISSYLGAGSLVSPVEGRAVYGIHSFNFAGLDPLTGDPQGYLDGQLSSDYTNLVNQDPSNLVYHGSRVPEVFGSINNTFTYRNFSLSFNLIYKLGYYFRRGSINYSGLFDQWSGHADFSDRWQNPGDEEYTNIPSLIYPNSNPNRDSFYNSSDILVENGGHLRFQDITFSYEFNDPSVSNPLIRKLRLFAYVSNLGLLWSANSQGLDPDYPINDYPLPTMVSFGVKTSF